MGRLPKFSTASNVRLPANQTSTGYVTIAVTLSCIAAFGIALIFDPVAAKRTRSTIGDGI